MGWFDPIVDAAEDVGNGIVDGAEAVGGAIVDGAEAAWDAATGAAEDAGQAVGNGFSSMVGRARPGYGGDHAVHRRR